MEVKASLSEVLPWDTAIALGFFDGVHLAHRKVINAVVEQQQNGLTPCVLSFTTRCSRPVSKQGERDILTESIKCRRLEELGVRCLLLPDFEDIRGCTPDRFVRRVLLGRCRGKFLSCGYDFRFGRGACGDTNTLSRYAAEINAKVEIVPPVVDDGQRVCSTRIRTLLRAGDIEEANRLLVEPYAFDHPVVQGYHNGRVWGFPTINQEFPEAMLVPRYGVYVSRAYWDGQWYGGVTNVGVKPTVSGENRPLAETHLFGLDADMYGKSVEVQLLQFLRPEQKFPSVEDLRTQVEHDMAQAQSILNEIS